MGHIEMKYPGVGILNHCLRVLNANPLGRGFNFATGLIWPVTIIPAGHFGPWQL
jgi:hypothetical protein